jgi:hypothetical protein
MRLALTFGAVLLVSLSLFLGSLPQSEYRFESLVPSDVLALAILDKPPATIDFLNHADVRQWVDIDLQAARARIPEEIRNEAAALFQRDLESVWLLLHSMEPQADAWRPDFTIVLVPKRFHAELLELRAELLTLRILGKGEAEVLDHGEIRVYRGGEDFRRVLYRVRMPGFLLLSNTWEGLGKTLRTFGRREPSLASSSDFQRVKAHLGFRQGLFLYVDSSRVFPLLPQFGYAVKWNGGEIRDKFYVTP